MAEPTRRVVLAAGLALAGGRAMAAEKLAWEFSFPGLEGGTVDLGAFKGKAVLVVNTASFCGYTYQYEALEKLHKARAADGLVVVGVPSGDFNQESADNKAVKDFCETRFGIDFPMTAISAVKGAKAVPFYAWVREVAKWEPAWNFNKVLIGRDGRVAGTFGSGDEPAGPKLAAGIDKALKTGAAA